MTRYRHKPSGAIFTTDRDMPSSEWEPVDDRPEIKDEERFEQVKEKPRRTTRSRRTASTKE